MKRPLNILITGASSGIGEAIALQCVADGAKNLFICGRDAGRLKAVADACRAKGDTKVYETVLDVTDENATREWLNKCDAIAPLELVFSNAGVGTGIEDEKNVRQTFAVNVNGNLNIVLPLINIFKESPVKRTRRQIVITASIAGYHGLSTCPAYSATKSCMKAWGEALRGMLAKDGIRVNTVCPGFVRSRITDRNTCPMPFFMEADKAAKIILDRVDSNVGLIAFPWPMRLAVWFLSTLPSPVAEFISKLVPAKL